MATAHGTFSERRGIGLQLQAQDGTQGRGEVTPLVEFGQAGVEEATRAVESFLGRAAGKALPDSLEAIPGYLADALPPAARYGVELAVLELLARMQSLPLARLLSGGARDRVRINALVSGDSLEGLRACVDGAVAQGFRTLKLKVGARSLAEDLKRVRAVRAQAPGGTRLRVDANGAWSEDQAKEALRLLQDLALELIEQPVAAQDFAALGRLHASKLCPIGADESLAVPRAAEALLGDAGGPLVDVVVLKPMVLGGLLPALELARRAEVLGAGAYVTHSMDGEVARAGAAHLAAALPSETFASGITFDAETLGESRLVGLETLGGFLHLSAEPGLGMSVRARRAS